MRAPLGRRYRNSVRFVDDTIGALLEEHAAEVDAGTMAVVVVGDHGEAFWEHGAWGHVGAPTDPAAIEVPLVACLPPASRPSPSPVAVAVCRATSTSCRRSWIRSDRRLRSIPARSPAADRSCAPPAADGSDDCALVTPKSFLSERAELYVVAGAARYWLAVGADKRLHLVRVTDADDRPLPTPAVTAGLCQPPPPPASAPSCADRRPPAADYS